MPVVLCTVVDPALHGNYLRWMRQIAPDVDLRFVTSVTDVDALLPEADGLLLPGGGDPAPELYGKPEAAALCAVEPGRDALELHAIEQAVRHSLPVLGICRGLQIATVAFGGTLIPDLPSAGFDGHHRLEGADRVHELRIDTDSLLADITGERDLAVNSAHHQGVDRVPARLRVSARSADGLPEALEWAQPAGKPFLLLVHWHPERLEFSHPASASLGAAFARAVRTRSDARNSV
jgi:putative glutamine amidotransferase